MKTENLADLLLPYCLANVKTFNRSIDLPMVLPYSNKALEGWRIHRYWGSASIFSHIGAEQTQEYFEKWTRTDAKSFDQALFIPSLENGKLVQAFICVKR